MGLAQLMDGGENCGKRGFQPLLLVAEDGAHRPGVRQGLQEGGEGAVIILT